MLSFRIPPKFHTGKTEKKKEPDTHLIANPPPYLLKNYARQRRHSHIYIYVHALISSFWTVLGAQVMAVFVNAARLVARREEQQRASSSSFRLRASTDGSIDRRRRPQIQASGIWSRERRFSISSRGAPD